MPLRDDHEAAIARADALERELAQERAKDREDAQRVERLEADVAAARERLAKAESELEALRENRKSVSLPPPVSMPTPEPGSPAPVRSPGTPPRSGPFAFVIAIGIIAMVVIVIASARSGRSDDEPPSGRALPEPPKPPFVAAAIVAEGIAKIRPPYRIKRIAVDYVGHDGLLDPSYGRVSIETERPRPPPPPDDPSRPTGAPAPTNDPLIGYGSLDPCPQLRWSANGWDESTGACFGLGAISTAPPTCSVATIIGWAKDQGAPHGLATLRAEWVPTLEGYEWRWTFQIKDDARGVSFDRERFDVACPAAPAERANPP